MMGFEGERSGNPSGKIIWNAGLVRIRFEDHPLEPGKSFIPRHHEPHFHVEIRPNTTVGWGNERLVVKLHPPGWAPAGPTGFLPGEAMP